MIFVDIDETIAQMKEIETIQKQNPLRRISKINKLDKGHELTYWSARGSATCIDWYSVTKAQFKNWGVKYHYLILGEKPVFDLLIDDKAINIDVLNDLDI